MLVVRPAGPADIDALLDLAFLSGKGFTSLPEDRAVLAERLALSAQSFAREVSPQHAWYTLMLEDTETGVIEGVAGIKGAVGLDRPHFSFRVMTLAQYSSATGTRFDHQALVLVNECTGSSEVGSLFLRPRKRQGGAGSLLARARYALIGANRDLFAATIMAELRGWFDERDESPFWHGIAAKFFRLPFEDADRMITATDGQFILDLAPRHPIYLELVDPAAREAIAKVHRHGARAGDAGRRRLYPFGPDRHFRWWPHRDGAARPDPHGSQCADPAGGGRCGRGGRRRAAASGGGARPCHVPRHADPGAHHR